MKMINLNGPVITKEVESVMPNLPTMRTPGCYIFSVKFFQRRNNFKPILTLLKTRKRECSPELFLKQHSL